MKLFVLIHTLQLLLSDYTVNELKGQLPNHDNHSKFQFQAIKITIFSLIENSVDKVNQRLKNKLIHALNGNINVNLKEPKFIKVTNWNKGNSDFQTFINAITYHIEEENSTIYIISESNVKKDENLEEIFPDFDIINKFENNHPKARLTMLIRKNTIDYERLHYIEKPNIAFIWIKIKLRSKKDFILCCRYCQWKLPIETNIPFTGTTQAQLERFDLLIGQI